MKSRTIWIPIDGLWLSKQKNIRNIHGHRANIEQIAIATNVTVQNYYRYIRMGKMPLNIVLATAQVLDVDPVAFSPIELTFDGNIIVPKEIFEQFK